MLSRADINEGLLTSRTAEGGGVDGISRKIRGGDPGIKERMVSRSAEGMGNCVHLHDVSLKGGYNRMLTE